VRELVRKGGRYTWTNKQMNPTMCVLDRMLVSMNWDQHYQLTTCESLTRVGSDHCPILVNTEDDRMRQPFTFRFESAWLTQPGFKECLREKLPQRGSLDVQDYWKSVKYSVRKFCKGWSYNLNNDMKKKRKELLLQLEILDKEAERLGLSKISGS
jgi:hypothetical protein